MEQELQKRIFSSIILIPLSLFFIIKGSFLFTFFIIIIFLVTSYEWFMMSKNKRYHYLGYFFLIFSFYNLFLKPSYIKTEQSPDGKYTMEIYRENLWFSMPGGGSDNMAYILLRDQYGNIPGTINGNSNCGAMHRDIEIRWTPTFAYYARGNAFNLKTGKTCE